MLSNNDPQGLEEFPLPRVLDPLYLASDGGGEEIKQMIPQPLISFSG